MGPESDRISTNQNDHDNVEARDRITFAQESTHPNTIPKRTDTSELATSDTTQYETHPSSLKKHNVVADKELKFEKLEIGERDERDFQKRQEFGGRRLFWLSYQAIGVIYGDIGTSPLYVFSSTFTSGEPSYDDLLGSLSLILWTLALIVTLKYALIVLEADDEGEGGTFAVYSLLSRFANIANRDPREDQRTRIERVDSNMMKASKKATRNFLEKSALMKTLLKTLGVFGVSLVMSDGVLTPAQSVLGAIQGLRVVDDTIRSGTIVGVTCTILILLFLMQPLGTSKIGTLFAPIVIIWLLFNFCFGIYNLAQFDHSVLKAFSPYYAGSFFVRNGTEGWKMLGGILLSFTGVEALFADLGAFSKRSIRFSWIVFGWPCLMMAYIGQAAYISRNKGAYTLPFFNSVPPGMFYPSLVIAILAAIVASQTMITATFQLMSQIVKLSYFPQIKVVHTSTIFHQQIYVPAVNWLLLIGTICVTAAYGNTTKLGEAYGVCVILVTFITTCMVTLVALIIWGLPVWLVAFASVTLLTLDGLYLSSALTKVPHGAWFTLCLAALLSSIFVLWRFGKEVQWKAEASDKVPMKHLVTPTSEGSTGLGVRLRGGSRKEAGLKSIVPVERLQGIGIFFDKTGDPPSAPTVFLHFLWKFRALPAVTVFLHVRPLSIPTVAPEDRFNVSRVKINPALSEGDDDLNRSLCQEDIFYVTLRHGYTDRVIGRDLGLIIYEHLCKYLTREVASRPVDEQSRIDPMSGPATPMDQMITEQSSYFPRSRTQAYRQTSVRHLLAALKETYEEQVVYIIGKEQMRLLPTCGCTVRGWVRRIALAAFLWIRSNTGRRVANWNLDAGRGIEVGYVKEL